MSLPLRHEVSLMLPQSVGRPPLTISGMVLSARLDGVAYVALFQPKTSGSGSLLGSRIFSLSRNGASGFPQSSYPAWMTTREINSMAKRSLSRMAEVLSTARNPLLDMDSANNATSEIGRAHV